MIRVTDDDIIERNLFEFVNRIAYIAYILTELLRPLPEWRNVNEKKNEIESTI